MFIRFHSIIVRTLDFSLWSLTLINELRSPLKSRRSPDRAHTWIWTANVGWVYLYKPLSKQNLEKKSYKVIWNKNPQRAYLTVHFKGVYNYKLLKHDCSVGLMLMTNLETGELRKHRRSGCISMFGSGALFPRPALPFLSGTVPVFISRRPTPFQVDADVLTFKRCQFSVCK